MTDKENAAVTTGFDAWGKPGDKFIVRDQHGNEHEDIIHSICYRSPEPEILQRLTGWRRILRKLTPPRWRTPLVVVRRYRPASLEVIGQSEYGRRAQRTAEDMMAAMERIGVTRQDG